MADPTPVEVEAKSQGLCDRATALELQALYNAEHGLPIECFMHDGSKPPPPRSPISTPSVGIRSAHAPRTPGGANKFWLEHAITTGYATAHIGSGSIGTTIDICDGDWHNIQFGFDGTLIHLIVDGVADTAAQAGTIPAIPMLIGARNAGGAPSYHCTGSISCVQSLNRAPSATEIAYLYSLGRNP